MKTLARQSSALELEWYERNFNEDYLKIYAHRSEENAGKEIEKIWSFVEKKPGQKVLDLCCGAGRHSRWLARQGLRVTGVDLSDTLLREAITHSPDLHIQYMRADARELPFVSEMDIVVNLAASFGYFSEDEENEKIIRQVSQALKPGGYFVFDFLNQGYLKRSLSPFTETKQGDIEILQYRSLREGYVNKRIVVKDGGNEREYEERIKLYRVSELTEMFLRNQLIVDYLFGDYEAGPYKEDSSPRIIMISKRADVLL
jgi:SAM-dependent methyltransferase